MLPDDRVDFDQRGGGPLKLLSELEAVEDALAEEAGDVEADEFAGLGLVKGRNSLVVFLKQRVAHLNY